MTETLHRKRAGKPVLISTQAAAFIVKVAVPSSGFYLPCPFHVASFMYYCGDNMRFVTTHAFLLCGSQLQLPQGFLRPSQVLTMTRQKRQCRRFLDRSHGNVHCSLSITDIRSSIYFSCPGPSFVFFCGLGVAAQMAHTTKGLSAVRVVCSVFCLDLYLLTLVAVRL